MIIIYVRNRRDYEEVVEVFEPMITDGLVEVNTGDLFNDSIDRHSYIFTPGNSFGIMDGGFDRAIKDRFRGIEKKVQKKIDEIYNGELSIGSAIDVDPGENKPIIIYAPTMRIPGKIPYGSIYVYQAFREALSFVPNIRHTNIFTPMFGTGYGAMNVKIAAAQMYMAIKLMLEPLNRSKWEEIRRSQRIIETGELREP